MASIKPIGDKWRAQIYVKGIRESEVFITRAKAVAWAAQRETELRTNAAEGILSGKSCRDAFDKYRREVSIKKKGERWEHIRLAALERFDLDGKLFGNIKLLDVTTAMLCRWRDERLKTVAGSTINRDLTLLSNVMKIAKTEWGWIAKNPVSNVGRAEEPPARDRRISQAEIEALCHVLGFDGATASTVSQRVAVAFLFALETAMRIGEICALNSSMIKGAVAHLPASITKTNQKRDVPLSNRAVELLSLLPYERLFDLTTMRVDALFRKAKKRAGIIDLHFHDTRHEAITRLAKKLDVLSLARMVGHNNLNQLMTYFNESAEDMAKRL